MMILAVSGGVDSVVMLDTLTSFCDAPKTEVIVAHFDHNMRENSHDDAVFVENLAKKYHVKFESGRAPAGKLVSEAEARRARYDFLNSLAQKYDAEIYTAHHLDDLIETIMINLIRGTGWRGLAALNTPGIRRPFLENGEKIFGKIPRKIDLINYAAEHQLNFREDQTNSSDEYLRNRVRARLDGAEIDEREIFRLWKRQCELCNEIDTLIREIMPKGRWEREWFSKMDDDTAIEILRSKVSLTRPQALNLLSAIRTYEPGKYFNLPNDELVRMDKKDFSLFDL